MAELSRKYGVPVTWTALLAATSTARADIASMLDLAAEQRKSERWWSSRR